jgi:small-conductance mechanosensitive channel
MPPLALDSSVLFAFAPEMHARDIAAVFAGYDWRDLFWSLGILAVAVLAGRLASTLAVRGLQRWAKRKKGSVADAVSARMHGPVRWLGPLVAVDVAVPLVTLPAGILEGVRQGILIGVIVGLGWLAVRTVGVAETLVLRRFDVSNVDNLRARAVYTQMRGMSNVLTFVIAVITLAFALMSFERVRQLGTGLLASAGLAGIALGFAAQKSLAAILAGIQIAITQPIRVDDVLIVEGEWGRVEEITLTYVVLRIWDARRLVVPIQYFLEKPFQN